MNSQAAGTASDSSAAVDQKDQVVRDEILRGLWRKGQACAADLANELHQPLPAEAILPVVEALESDGLVRPVPDPALPTDDPFQTVYELAR